MQYKSCYKNANVYAYFQSLKVHVKHLEVKMKVEVSGDGGGGRGAGAGGDGVEGGDHGGHGRGQGSSSNTVLYTGFKRLVVSLLSPMFLFNYGSLSTGTE